MDEDIRYTVIEYATCDSVFAKDKNGKAQSKQDARLQMVPRSGKRRWRIYVFLSRCPGLDDSCLSPELLKAKDDTT